MIGIVGGIGSGKSSVAKQLAKTRSLLILDGDQVGHEQFNNTSVQQEIRKRFGDDAFDESENVSRRNLGRMVFGSTDQHARARRDLEAILHPGIRSQFLSEIEKANQTDQFEAVILDAALLLEAGWQELCQAVVFIDTPYDIRRQRVMQNRGWVDGELEKRESNQLSIEEKKSRSDYTIDNSGTLDEASQSLDKILSRIVSNTDA